MTTEALRLADALRDGTYLLSVERVATESELRRLSARCAELEAQAERLADMGLEVERQLVAARASDQSLRSALAAIYQALGTSNSDMTAWPEEIRELRNTIAAQAECIRANNAERQEWQREVVSLRAEVAELHSARIAYASEFPMRADGEKDVGSIHQNIRRMKAECEALRAEAARKEEVMSTHGPGCYAWGPGHYECALREIETLRPNAERWMMLREESKRYDPVCALMWKRNSDRNSAAWVNVVDVDEDMDAAIDAAMKEKT